MTLKYDSGSGGLLTLRLGWLIGSLFGRRHYEGTIEWEETAGHGHHRPNPADDPHAREIQEEIMLIMDEIRKIDIKLGGDGTIKFEITDIETDELVELTGKKTYRYVRTLDFVTAVEVRSHLRVLLKEYRDKFLKYYGDKDPLDQPEADQSDSDRP